MGVGGGRGGACRPLPATLALRDREARQLFRDLAGLTRGITDFGGYPTHGVFVSRLHQEHPYAYNFWFWSEVEKAAPRA